MLLAPLLRGKFWARCCFPKGKTHKLWSTVPVVTIQGCPGFYRWEAQEQHLPLSEGKLWGRDVFIWNQRDSQTPGTGCGFCRIWRKSWGQGWILGNRHRKQKGSWGAREGSNEEGQNSIVSCNGNRKDVQRVGSGQNWSKVKKKKGEKGSNWIWRESSPYKPSKLLFQESG